MPASSKAQPAVCSADVTVLAVVGTLGDQFAEIVVLY